MALSLGVHLSISSEAGCALVTRSGASCLYRAECTFVTLSRLQTCWTGLAGWQCQPPGSWAFGLSLRASVVKPSVSGHSITQQLQRCARHCHQKRTLV